MTTINITNISQWNSLATASITTRINKNILISANLFFQLQINPLFLANGVIVNGQTFTIYCAGSNMNGLFNFPANGFGTIQNLVIDCVGIEVNPNQSVLMYYNGTSGQYGTFTNVHVLQGKIVNNNTAYFFCTGFGNSNITTLSKCSADSLVFNIMPFGSAGFISSVPVGTKFQFTQCNINNNQSNSNMSGTNYGGFIYQNNGNVVFSQCVVQHCALDAGSGGFIANNNGVLSFDRCVVNNCNVFNDQFAGFVNQDIHGSNGNYITISNCYSNLDCTSIFSASNYISAFIGLSKGCTITNSYGIFFGIGVMNSNIGAFVGSANGTNTFTNCFTFNNVNRQGTPTIVQSLPSLETYANILPPNWSSSIWGFSNSSSYPFLNTFLDTTVWDGNYLIYSDYINTTCQLLNNCFSAYPKYGFSLTAGSINGQYDTRKHLLTVGQSWFKMFGNYTNTNNIQNIMLQYANHTEFDIPNIFPSITYDPLFRMLFICGGILNYVLNASISWNSNTGIDIQTYNYDAYILSRSDLIKKYIFGTLIDANVPSDLNYYNNNSSSNIPQCLNMFSLPVESSNNIYKQTILDEMYRYACRKEVELAIPQGFYNNVQSTFTNISVNNNWDRLLRFIFTPKMMLEELADNNGNNEPYISFLPNPVNPNYGDPFCVISDFSNPDGVDQRYYYKNLLRMQQFNIGSLLRHNFINTAMYYLYVSLKQILGYTETTFFKDMNAQSQNLILLNMDRYYYYLSYVLFPLTSTIRINQNPVVFVDYVTNIFQIFKYTINTNFPIPSYTTSSTGINILTSATSFTSIKDFEVRQPQFILIQGYGLSVTNALQVNVLNYNGYTPWLVCPLTVTQNTISQPIDEKSLLPPNKYQIVNHNDFVDTASAYFNLNNNSQSIPNDTLAQGFLKNTHTQFNALFTRIFVNGIDDLYFINSNPNVSNVAGIPIQTLFSSPAPYSYLPYNPRYPYDIQVTPDNSAIQNLTAFTYKVPTSTLKINVSQVLVSSLTWTASTISLPSGQAVVSGQTVVSKGHKTNRVVINQVRTLKNIVDRSLNKDNKTKITFSQKDMSIFMKRQKTFINNLSRDIIGATYCGLTPQEITNTSLNEYLLLRSTIDGLLVGLKDGEVSFLLNIEYFDPKTVSSNPTELALWSKLVCVVILYRTQKILYPYLKTFYDINITRTTYGKRPMFFSQSIDIIDNTLVPYSDLVNSEINTDITIKYNYFLKYSKFIFN